MRKEIYIIGGGASLIGFDFAKLKNKDTMTINKSLFYLNNPTYHITMDYASLRKINKISLFDIPKFFIANLSTGDLIEKNGQFIDKKTTYILKDFDIIIKSYKAEGIGFKWNDFRNGRNSAYCALQLAILMGYKKINLLGIDLIIADNQTHFHGGYGEPIERFKRKLERYYQYFKEGIKEICQKTDIKIYSCSSISRLNNILPYKEI